MAHPLVFPVQYESQQRIRFAPVYALVHQAIAECVFPGCTFGVLERATDGSFSVAALDGAGRQIYEEGSPKVRADTVYDLASLTKVVGTTAMAMLLHQRGILALDLPVAAVLPGFAQGQTGQQPDRSQVTVRHLLAHNSGLAGYARLFEDFTTPETLFSACLRMPLEAAPGARAEYSDIGFILLGRLLETLAAEGLAGFSRREIFAPLGMESCGFQPPAEQRNAIPPTEDDKAFRYRVIQGEVQDENCAVLGGVSGHPGLFGNAPDLLRFSQALLSGDFCDQATLRLFASRVNQPPGSSRALGWDTPSQPSSSGEHFSTQSIGHLGYSGTSLWIDIEAGCAVVLLTNRTWPSRQNQKIRQFRPVFHDLVRKSLQVEPFSS